MTPSDIDQLEQMRTGEYRTVPAEAPTAQQLERVEATLRAGGVQTIAALERIAVALERIADGMAAERKSKTIAAGRR